MGENHLVGRLGQIQPRSSEKNLCLGKFFDGEEKITKNYNSINSVRGNKKKYSILDLNDSQIFSLKKRDNPFEDPYSLFLGGLNPACEDVLKDVSLGLIQEQLYANLTKHESFHENAYFFSELQDIYRRV